MINYRQIEYIENDCSIILDGQLNTLNDLQNQAIYISGASGFVGKWIIELVNYLNKFHSFNIKVIASSSSIKQGLKLFPHIFNKKEILLVEKDIKNITDVDSQVTYVIHLAGSPDNRNYASNPVKAMNDIVIGTSQLLNACSRLENLKKVMYYSTGHVYGVQPIDSANITESCFYNFDSSSCANFYAEAKRVGESLMNAYRSQFKLPVIILRPFAFIGPYQLLNRPWAVNNFIRDGLNGQQIRILGDAKTVRSYMYPSEMALWTLRSLLNNSDETVFNLGSSDGMDLNSIAQIIEHNFGGNLGVSKNVMPDSLKQSKFVPSVEKFEQVFDVKLKISTEAALKKAIEWYQLEN